MKLCGLVPSSYINVSVSNLYISRIGFARCSDIGQSFTPIGLHKTNAAFDWLLIKRNRIAKKGLPEVQLQN